MLLNLDSNMYVRYCNVFLITRNKLVLNSNMSVDDINLSIRVCAIKESLIKAHITTASFHDSKIKDLWSTPQFFKCMQCSVLF